MPGRPVCQTPVILCHLDFIQFNSYFSCKPGLAGYRYFLNFFLHLFQTVHPLATDEAP